MIISYSSRTICSWEIFRLFCKENYNNLEPFKWINILNLNNKQVSLNGIFFPNILNRVNQHEEEEYWDYFEILNNGFFESGISADVIWYYKDKPILNLTKAVGYAWLMLSFAKLFFNKIKYFEAVSFYISWFWC